MATLLDDGAGNILIDDGSPSVQLDDAVPAGDVNLAPALLSDSEVFYAPTVIGPRALYSYSSFMMSIAFALVMLCTS